MSRCAGRCTAAAIIQAVDSLVPDSARQLFANFLRLVEQQGFPQVFAGLGGDTIVPTTPPDPALAAQPGGRQGQARAS